MTRDDKSRIATIVRSNESEILDDWIRSQLAAVSRRSDLISETALRDESRSFLGVFTEAMQHGGKNAEGKEWDEVRSVLERLSRSRALKGFSPSETAVFVFYLKEALFNRLRAEYAKDPAALADESPPSVDAI